MAALRLFRSIKKVQWAIVRAVQVVLIPVCLTLVYVVGLGLTWFLALLFAPRKGLGLFVGHTESYWVKAEGYGQDIESCSKPF